MREAFLVLVGIGDCDHAVDWRIGWLAAVSVSSSARCKTAAVISHEIANNAP